MQSIIYYYYYYYHQQPISLDKDSDMRAKVADEFSKILGNNELGEQLVLFIQTHKEHPKEKFTLKVSKSKRERERIHIHVHIHIYIFIYESR